MMRVADPSTSILSNLIGLFSEQEMNCDRVFIGTSSLESFMLEETTLLDPKFDLLVSKETFVSLSPRASSNSFTLRIPFRYIFALKRGNFWGLGLKINMSLIGYIYNVSLRENISI